MAKVKYFTIDYFQMKVMPVCVMLLGMFVNKQKAWRSNEFFS